jgi:hypothetical protein
VFERFSDRARRVLVLAQEEAHLLDHGFIGTEHLLLGLPSISEEGGHGDDETEWACSTPLGVASTRMRTR